MLKNINIGFLDRRVTIQNQATSKDTDGFPLEAWSNLFTNVPAAKHYGAGTEKENDGTNTPEQQVDYLLRYHASITTSCRVVEGGDVYEIHAIDELGRRQGMLLKCKWYGNTTS